jgi:hypothetical protein
VELCKTTRDYEDELYRDFGKVFNLKHSTCFFASNNLNNFSKVLKMQAATPQLPISRHLKLYVYE